MKQRTDPKTWFAIEGGNVDYEVDEFPDGSFRFRVDCDDINVNYVISIDLLTTLPPLKFYTNPFPCHCGLISAPPARNITFLLSRYRING